MTPEEKTEVRRVIGQVAWIARQTRPDLLAGCSLLAQAMGDLRVSHIVEANTLVRDAHENAEFKIVFKGGQISYLNGQFKIVCASDASLTNAEASGDKLRSQAGYVIGIQAKDGCGIHFVEFNSSTIRRVCRSTLAAEANGLVTAAEAMDYLRSVVLAILHPGMQLTDLMDRGDIVPAVCYTDARSVHDVVVRDTSRPADKRIRVVVAQLREILTAPGNELKWLDNSMMLADALTKLSAERQYLLQAISDNCWSDEITEEGLAAKKRIRDGRHQRAAAAREAKKIKKT